MESQRSDSRSGATGPSTQGSRGGFLQWLFLCGVCHSFVKKLGWEEGKGGRVSGGCFGERVCGVLGTVGFKDCSVDQQKKIGIAMRNG